MPGTYNYEPSQITTYGKDRMRFELGDVMVDGKERTCALCDEEYHLLTEGVKTVRAWKKAKLKWLSSEPLFPVTVWISPRFSMTTWSLPGLLNSLIPKVH